MELKELQDHIRTSALMEETRAVVTSSYLKLEKGRVANRDCFQQRVNLVREVTAGPKLNGFEEAVARIGEYANTKRLADSGRGRGSCPRRRRGVFPPVAI